MKASAPRRPITEPAPRPKPITKPITKPVPSPRLVPSLLEISEHQIIYELGWKDGSNGVVIWNLLLFNDNDVRAVNLGKPNSKAGWSKKGFYHWYINNGRLCIGKKEGNGYYNEFKLPLTNEWQCSTLGLCPGGGKQRKSTIRYCRLNVNIN
jgi:hypothetical protein